MVLLWLAAPAAAYPNSQFDKQAFRGFIEAVGLVCACVCVCVRVCYFFKLFNSETPAYTQDPAFSDAFGRKGYKTFEDLKDIINGSY